MTNRRTKNPGAGGQVDFDAVRESVHVANARWRALRHNQTKEIVRVFAYSARPPNRGPWVGYDSALMPQAPCTHCGRAAFDRPLAASFLHLCKGYYVGRESESCAYDGLRNDDGEHVCTGIPSMSWHGVKRWSETEWSEIP